MGITGLLPYLEVAGRDCHISEFKGSVVGIDVSCWLHKAASTFAKSIIIHKDYQHVVRYIKNYVEMLSKNGIKPVLVFDGKALPAKAGVNTKRSEKRKEYKQRSDELLALGDTVLSEKYLQRSISIKPELIAEVIKACHQINVDCIVAPYEADAQLAYLCNIGAVNIAITEDSDLMLFGCKSVIYKLDAKGNGVLIEAHKIHYCMGLQLEQYTFNKFLYMCILSGCDYLPSLPGIGLKKAEKFIKLTEETDPLKFLGKLARYLRITQLVVTDDYKENFMTAVATFKHQIVFDPFLKKLVHLTDPIGVPDKYLKNAGSFFDNKEALELAVGNISTADGTRLANWNITKCEIGSIWHKIDSRNLQNPQNATIKSNIAATGKSTYTRNIDKKLEEKFSGSKFNLRETLNISIQQSKVEDELKEEADSKIKTEINRLSLKRKMSDADSTDGSGNEDSPGSPVLVKNPFMKKISKFAITESVETENVNVSVQSRYFSFASSSSNTQYRETKQELESSDELKNLTQGSDNSIPEIIQAAENTDNIENQPNNFLNASLAEIHIEDKQSSSIPITVTDCAPSTSKPQQRKRKLESTDRGAKKKQLTGQTSIKTFFKSYSSSS
ncbi:exonuclease 1 [Diabrotica undecimpunctata]|uniref:exonuclease 1 n=1 Tax=Diabrotica undecimpunctata TaxID=50387 RepID=UPI003B64111A